MIVELILTGGHREFSGLVGIAVFYHLAYFLDREFLRQGYCAAHAGLVRGSRSDRYVIQRQDGLLDGDKEVE